MRKTETRSFRYGERPPGLRVFLSVFPDQRGERAVVAEGGEKTPLRNQFAFRVRSEERRNLLFVLLRFHAACGIEQMSARFDQTDLRVQNLFLKRRDFVQAFCIETAQFTFRIPQRR